MATETLQPGDWRPFCIELILADDLNSAVYYSNVSPPPAKLDLQGRELTLTITNPSAGDLLMDSLKVEELPAAK